MQRAFTVPPSKWPDRHLPTLIVANQVLCCGQVYRHRLVLDEPEMLEAPANAPLGSVVWGFRRDVDPVEHHRAAVRSLRLARPVTPRAIRRGRCGRSYDLVARTERDRIERGQSTPQVQSA